MLDEAELGRDLPIGFIGQPLYFYDRLESTNDKAKELASRGALEGTLVIAREQTAGRGRAGSVWISDPRCSLTFSLVLRPEKPLPRSLAALSLLGALAVSTALKEYNPSPTIKWPNDVLLNDRKVAGVLVEASWLGNLLEWAVLGIGINVKRSSMLEGVPLDYPAASIEDSLGVEMSLNQFMPLVLDQLQCWYQELGSEKMRKAWEASLAFVGEAVELSSSDKKYLGVLIGLSHSGNLILKSATGGMQEIPAGAGSLRAFDSE
jgi:BirA family biotin operon repressor/biotin-[acetyl-CoA-carboxylase] ligase